jgi:Fe-S oxidoreductase
MRRQRLGARKGGNLIAAHTDLVAAGNIGCLTQIATHLHALGDDPRDRARSTCWTGRT